MTFILSDQRTSDVAAAFHDEFRLTEDGNVLHEIEWWSLGAIGHWLIEASDVEFAWTPTGRAVGA